MIPIDIASNIIEQWASEKIRFLNDPKDPQEDCLAGRNIIPILSEFWVFHVNGDR
jgi:hypothetical protein